MADDINAKPERDIRDGVPKSAFAKASDQVRIRTERFRQVYANNMTLSLNSWDVAVVFGEIVGEQEGKTVIEETVRVSMTREIAKVLAQLLNNHLAIFEERFWEVKLPISDDASGENKPEAKSAEVEAAPKPES